MQLKSFNEFSEHFIFSSLAAFNIWMHRGVVLLSQVVYGEDTIAVEVESFEGSDYDLLSELAEWALDHSHKLIEVNHTVAVGVERFEKTIDIFWVNLETEIIDCFSELILVQSAGAVVVHYLEAACKTNQAAATTLDHLCAESLNHNLLVFRNCFGSFD